MATNAPPPPVPRHITPPGSLPALLTVLPAFTIGFVFSLWYLDVYWKGDQAHYSRFYDALYRLPIEYWIPTQRTHLGSSEPLYAYLIGIAASVGVDRIPYLAFWNGVLIAATAYALRLYKCSLLFGFLILTNYYIQVMLGSAERLKFAYIALILSVCVISPRWKIALAISSIFFHTQALFQLAASAAQYAVDKRKEIVTSPLRTLLVSIGALAAVGLIGYLFMSAVGESVASKSETYSSRSGGLVESVSWGLLLGSGIYVFRNKLAFIAAMMPLGLATTMYGNRVNVATFMLFAWLAMTQRQTNHPLVLAVLAYMSWKSIPFLLDVVRYGTGY